MSDYGSIGDAIGGFMAAMVLLLCVSVPLGLWKLIEIIIWICHHVSISLG